MALVRSMLYHVIILIFYSNGSNSAEVEIVNDSWLWPNKVDSVIDNTPTTKTENVVFASMFDYGLAMRHKKLRVSYKGGPYIGVGGHQNKENSSTWKKLNNVEINTNNGYLGFSRSMNNSKDKNNSIGTLNESTHQTTEQHFNNDFNFPDEYPIKRKAEIKCAEYNKVISDTGVWIHPLVGSWSTSASTRKRVSNKCRGLQNPLIIGGATVKPGEFSHMVALGWISRNNKTTFLCGGSLISNRWVLTAAHCTHGPSGAPKVVRIGARMLEDQSSGKLVQILQIVRHPSYKPPAVYADLALVKLDTTVNFGTQIRPACLYTEFDTSPLQAWATGWGVTGIGEGPSDELLKVRLDVIDNVDCALKLNRSAAIPRGIVPSMLCAGDVSGDWRSDTCQGDSGGPLQILHPNHKCLYQIIGVTSFGRLCALKNSPGVYTRVSHYLEWIEMIVWPDKDQ